MKRASGEWIFFGYELFDDRLSRYLAAGEAPSARAGDGGCVVTIHHRKPKEGNYGRADDAASTVHGSATRALLEGV